MLPPVIVTVPVRFGVFTKSCPCRYSTVLAEVLRKKVVELLRVTPPASVTLPLARSKALKVGSRYIEEESDPLTLIVAIDPKSILVFVAVNIAVPDVTTNG